MTKPIKRMAVCPGGGDALGINGVDFVALEEVAGRMRRLPLGCSTPQTGRDLGVCFGD